MYRNRFSITRGSPFAMLAASVAVAIACSAAGMARASVINVELGYQTNYAGTGAAPDTGTFWNQASSGGSYTLETSTGATSVVTFSVATEHTYTGTYNGSPSVNTLLNNYIYLYNAAVPFTIGGLTQGQSYDLYLYGTNGQNGKQATTFTIGSASLSTTAGLNSATATTIPTSDSGISYVEFTNLTPVFNAGKSDYEIQGSWQNVGINTFGVFNGLQLVPVSVPEPATLGLAVVGAMGLLLLKRRKAI